MNSIKGREPYNTYEKSVPAVHAGMKVKTRHCGEGWQQKFLAFFKRFCNCEITGGLLVQKDCLTNDAWLLTIDQN
jgi:hypothetical protein